MTMDRPWTVSVAEYPGEETCVELQRLDRAIRKDRGWREGDDWIERWKALIEWPAPFVPEPIEWADLPEPWDRFEREYLCEPVEYGEPLVARALLQGIPVKADPTIPLDEFEVQGTRFKLKKGR